MSDFYLVSGDTLPVLSAVLADFNGPVSLDGAEAVAFSMRDLNGLVVVDSAEATPDADQDANPGLVTYAWAAGETDLDVIYGSGLVGGAAAVGIVGPVLFNGAFAVTWENGIQTYPNAASISIEIGEKVAG